MSSIFETLRAPTTRENRVDHYATPWLEMVAAVGSLLDDAGTFVAHHPTGCDRKAAVEDLDVGSANRTCDQSHNRVVERRFFGWTMLESHIARFAQNGCSGSVACHRYSR